MEKHYYKIDTQFIENYGAHSEPVTNHWKFKGGDTYFVISSSPRIANAVAFVATYLANDGCQTVEIPVQWAEVSSTEMLSELEERNLKTFTIE